MYNEPHFRVIRHPDNIKTRLIVNLIILHNIIREKTAVAKIFTYCIKFKKCKIFERLLCRRIKKKITRYKS